MAGLGTLGVVPHNKYVWNSRESSMSPGSLLPYTPFSEVSGLGHTVKP